MEKHKFSNEDTQLYLINPHPERAQGLGVGFREDGLVGIWMIADPTTSFCISPEAAIILAELIKLHVKTDSLSVAT